MTRPMWILAIAAVIIVVALHVAAWINASKAEMPIGAPARGIAHRGAVRAWDRIALATADSRERPAPTSHRKHL